MVIAWAYYIYAREIVDCRGGCCASDACACDVKHVNEVVALVGKNVADCSRGPGVVVEEISLEVGQSLEFQNGFGVSGWLHFPQREEVATKESIGRKESYAFNYVKYCVGIVIA